MVLTRDRAVAALTGCAELTPFRRGALKSFLGTLTDDKLRNLPIPDENDDGEIAGFLDDQLKQVERTGAGIGSSATGSKKHGIDGPIDGSKERDAIHNTNQGFRNALKALSAAPTSFNELEAMLASGDDGLIPVLGFFYQEMQTLPERKFLVHGHGPLAAYMTVALQSLAECSVEAGQTEQTTAIETSSWLFKHLYDKLERHLRSGLQVFLNAATARVANCSGTASPTLFSPIEGLERPDVVVMSQRNVSLLILEEKKGKEMAAAEQDICRYLAGGLPVAYQKIQGIPVAAVAGRKIKFGFCDAHGTVNFMPNAMEVGSAGGAIQAMAAALKVYRLVLLLDKQAPKSLMEMGLGGVLERPYGCSIYFGSRNHGIIKIIDNFQTYAADFGADFNKIKDAYKAGSPFLPEIKGEASLILLKKKRKFRVQSLTFGMKLEELAQLEEEKAARCVYAWLSVAYKLHAKGICAADFRWPNMMEQQKPAWPQGVAPNPAYDALESIPLIIDLELARAPDLKPPAVLQSWVDGEGGTLQRLPQASAMEEAILVYTRSSDVYQIGVMLEQWQDLHRTCSPGVTACVAKLKSHEHTAAHIAQNDPWLHGARTAFAGLV